MYTNNIEGWMEQDELEWLYSISQEMESIVEIGSWKGRSTHALCSGCKGEVTSIDIYGSHYVDFQKNIKEFTNLITIHGLSLDVIKTYPDKYFDMVFIDADHSYSAIWSDITFWKPKAKKIISGHDYGEHCPGVIKAVDELLLPIERYGYSIWSKRLE